MQQFLFPLTIFVITFVIYLRIQSETENVSNYFILSTTYYNQSKFYPDNTVVILFNAKKGHVQAQKIVCESRNETSVDFVRARVRFSTTPTPHCQFAAYIAVCSVVQNPTAFGINNKNGKIAKLVVREPYREKTPIVVCFSPLFYFEKWELLVTSLEVYKYYGADLQVLYIQSMLEEIYNLLKIYTKNKIVAIEPWAAHDPDPLILKKIGYDPNRQLAWRNQASAHTDCTIKYREAADFIIVADVDDVLIPTFAKNYLSEFRKLSKAFPNSMGFGYPRFNAVVKSSKSPQEFSLSKVFDSMQVSLKNETFKHVFDTRRVETTWLHWPGLFQSGYELYILPEHSYMLHLRNWTESSIPDPVFKPHKRQIKEVISSIDERRLQIHFLKRLSKTVEFTRLSTKSVYSKLIDNCYENIFYSIKRKPLDCPGPAQCVFEHQPGLNCVVAKKVTTTTVVSRSLWLIAPRANNFFIMHSSGCNIR